jgi:hypothetical protein
MDEKRAPFVVGEYFDALTGAGVWDFALFQNSLVLRQTKTSKIKMKMKML